MIIESPKTIVSKPAQEVFTLMSDVKNFETLMPENIEKFEVTGREEFIFALKGMPEIALRCKEKSPPEKIVYEAADGKVPFTLTLHLHEATPGATEIQFVFEGKFNPMMAMMIKKPIGNFIAVLSKNTVKL